MVFVKSKYVHVCLPVYVECIVNAAKDTHFCLVEQDDTVELKLGLQRILYSLGYSFVFSYSNSKFYI